MDLTWALAFLEGEGSFFIAITRNRAGWYLRPRFAVSLHEGDRSLLEMMGQLFNKHGVKTHLNDDRYQREARSSRTKSVLLSVRGVGRCSKLAELFAPLRWYSKKYRDFLIWEYALQLFEEVKAMVSWNGPRKWTRQRIFDMVYLRSHMNCTKRRPRSNRNQAEILAWDLETSEHVLAFLEDLDRRMEAFRRENLRKLRQDDDNQEIPVCHARASEPFFGNL
jgi:hypothetical protein